MDEITKSIILEHLNQVAPDTFDEGGYGNWTFESIDEVEDKPNTYWIGFSTSRSVAEGTDDDCFIVFETGAPALVDGAMNSVWFNVISLAARKWEMETNGEEWTGDDTSEYV